ncbi:hypothetical protein ACFVT1_12050 [Streptomyces sp. NPDC057963]|uniref:hypothetical protein n=1 Tax=Streptomyces sp. NPDC057963 TaxID=3346290 RepID=UPI0036DFD39E
MAIQIRPSRKGTRTGTRDTIKAVRSVIARDVRNASTPDAPTRTQGAVADRRIRQHAPDRLCGEDADLVDEE